MMDLLNPLLSAMTDTSFLFGISVIVMYIVLRYIIIDRSNGLPPGPRFRLPIVGNMYAMDSDMRKFLRRYKKKYGDLYSLYFGNKLVIIIADFDKLKEAFVKNADVFSDRPKGNIFFNEISEGKGVSFVDMELWKEHRKFGLLTLRSFGMGKSIMEKRIHSEVHILLEHFKSQDDKAFDPGNITYVSVSNVMNSLAFGGHFNHDDKRYMEMIHRMNEAFSDIAFSGITAFFPALKYLPGDLFRIKRAKNNVFTVRNFLREFVNEHLQNYDENNIEDFSSAFIKEMKKQRNNATTTFNVEQLVQTLLEYFTAGTETTSSLIRWALIYLVNFPDLQEQLFRHIVGKIGTSRLPSVQDKTKLPLIEAFVQECLRHANLLFTSMPRAASQDVIFSGYLIPKEALILGDLDSVHHDNKIWKDPEVFRPDRFIDESGSLVTPEQLIPFFLGRRSCLGESLAKMELYLFFSAIVQNFQISAAPGEDLSLDKMDTFGLSHIPKPYKIIAHPRGQLPI